MLAGAFGKIFVDNTPEGTGAKKKAAAGKTQR